MHIDAGCATTALLVPTALGFVNRAIGKARGGVLVRTFRPDSAAQLANGLLQFGSILVLDTYSSSGPSIVLVEYCQLPVKSLGKDAINRVRSSAGYWYSAGTIEGPILYSYHSICTVYPGTRFRI